MEQAGLLAEKQLLILEPDTAKKNDRTWCFWSDKTDAAYQLCEEIISSEYSEIVVGSEVYPIAPFKYFQIRSADLYAEFHRLVRSYTNIELRAEKVEQVQEANGVVNFQVEDQSLKCKMFFDGRPPSLKGKSLLLWQSFVGWRVKTSKAIFHPARATFMDFSLPQHKHTEFMYVLPDSPTEALVEHTRFARPVLSEPDSQPVLNNYLAKIGVTDYEIREKEVAKIPMTNRLSISAAFYPETARWVDIGVRAGAAKASTGFAFKAMATHAHHIATALANKSSIPRLGHPSRFQLYDEMLLEMLDSSPETGHRVFQQMFETVGSDLVFKFLDEQTTFPEELAIMWNSPRGKFINSGLRLLRRLAFR